MVIGGHVTSMSRMYFKVTKPSLNIKQAGEENRFQLVLPHVFSSKEVRISLTNKKFRLQSLINP